jgi:4-hydroxybenzoate polyprenyltransferase
LICPVFKAFRPGKAERKNGIQATVSLGIQKQNLVLALCIAVAAVFLFLWVCPYMADLGHRKLCIALYGLLLLIYVFGRANVVRPRRDAPKPKL